MNISPQRYDHYRESLDSFWKLSPVEQQILLDRMGFILTLVQEQQDEIARLEDFRFNQFTELEVGLKNTEQCRDELEAENARLRAELAEARTQPRHTTVHVIRPVSRGNQPVVQG